MLRAPEYTGGEIQPDLNSNPLDKWTPKPERPGQPINAAMCKPGDVRFVHEEVILPRQASPPEGLVIASIQAQHGLTYEGVWVRWGCPYEWLVRTGVITVRVMTREKTPYPLAEFNQQPDEPIWLPWCQQGGSALEVRAVWTDANLTGAAETDIPFWAEMALGTSDAPSFDDDNANRVPRRRSDLLPLVVLPGGAFNSLSPGVIRPTAGRLWMQSAPPVGPPVLGAVQFAFATVRGGAVGATGGNIPGAGLNVQAEIHVDDLRDVFIGDPGGTLVAPVTINFHREVW